MRHITYGSIPVKDTFTDNICMNEYKEKAGNGKRKKTEKKTLQQSSYFLAAEQMLSKNVVI